MRHTILAHVFVLLSLFPAAAMVGGAAPAGPAGDSVVTLVSPHGSCSGVALASSLVLTAAHCVRPGFDYKIAEYDNSNNLKLKDVAVVRRHPGFDATAAERNLASADVALLKIGTALRSRPAGIAPAGSTVAAGDRLVVVGTGLATPGEGKSGGTARAAQLVVTGQPGSLQIRLMDPATRGEQAGLGACTGDSGAPAFRDHDGRLLVIGIVSWTTGPKLSEGCGGLTGVTPLTRYRAWIVDTAKALGNPLNP
ncbi:MAG TPA: S1 family peptidase [Xanthobacteraceae bacterium]|nr:S1 family peptidase [Xanthobacteraceae bacterium]